MGGSDKAIKATANKATDRNACKENALRPVPNHETEQRRCRVERSARPMVGAPKHALVHVRSEAMKLKAMKPRS